MVRVFTYDALDRGKELSYYVADCPPKQRGDMVAVGNDGSESTEQVDFFFDHCPYRTDAAAYMAQVYQQNRFDIDSLVNKIVVSPGHLFTKLFVKYLYAPLRKGNWSLIKSKTALVVKSIETGCLLHVLSRKTVYFKEGKSAGKMTVTPHESHREIGSNGEVFVEKTIGCYREVNMQTYPLNPYLSYLIVRQMSNKVKHNSVPSFHDSYLGFLCILGCFETKNVGRTTMMVRNTVVSTCDALDPVFHDAQRDALWTWLQLEPDSHIHPHYFVVINEACVPVTVACFQRIQLEALKQQFQQVECFTESNFMYIRYKVGLLFKRLPGTDVWVTPKDMMFWARKLLQLHTMEELIDRFGYDFITSFHVDLNPLFMHNAFPKNTLAFNALKNAVLATDARYAHYFMDSLSAYARQLTPYHQIVQEPVQDGISPHFALRVPHVVVSYMSFLGCTQEDGIVCRQDVNAFDCCRFYTIRIKIKADGLVMFHPVQGDADETSLVGTVVHFGDTLLQLEPFSIHVRTVPIKDQVIQLHFNKPPFRVIQHYLSAHTLSICLEQDHWASTGDKLCSFHGQKGVLRLMKTLPLLDERIQPDLLVNPYSLFRMTPGQILEGVTRGEGRDAQTVRNTDGQIVPDAKAFYAKTFYFPIAYWSSEHFYAPSECTMDKILHQAVKGRSRGGGMRLGNMELFNGLRGNGLAACFEEKFFEHGDRIPNEHNPTISLPKSVELVKEDARFFKCHLKYQANSSVIMRK
ncbi:RNA_pol_Rpb2_6 domain-containing protein [Trichonephila clavata]|uniref:DNA-directed RNA polymerase n=1 Tax=Trichonephila clavata TaxID=2740835 RepID=A0A8X6H544_TRICU|nr:RNA_pol_Rpb2_6 domain-containing protein [Trichonephila clavata]GFR17158.1 RNA_pol_Rpb2_6 domain-containing protein [Trichonephila clavata]